MENGLVQLRFALDQTRHKVTVEEYPMTQTLRAVAACHHQRNVPLPERTHAADRNASPITKKKIDAVANLEIHAKATRQRPSRRADRQGITSTAHDNVQTSNAVQKKRRLPTERAAKETARFVSALFCCVT